MRTWALGTGVATAALLAAAVSGGAPAVWRLPGGAPAPGSPTVPGPAPRQRTFDAAAVNAQCEACHLDVATEWRASLHRQAHTDPSYVAQFAKEPLAFCTGCHAPEANPAGPVPAALSRLGVGCVTCHVVGDRILAAKTAPAGARPAPHALSRTDELQGAGACGACHEFAFPEFQSGKDRLLMQSTMSEHATSPFAKQTCASCHMPTVTTNGRSHRSHAFAASRDADLIRSAVIVEEDVRGGRLRLTLRPGQIGHAFPTGDLLRRLKLSIEVRKADGSAVERVEKLFMKNIGTTRVPHAAPRKLLLSDDRVGATPGDVVHDFVPRKRPAGGSLHYTLRYERVGDPTGGPHGTALIEGGVTLADRTIPIP